jgi:hypothetical protein
LRARKSCGQPIATSIFPTTTDKKFLRGVGIPVTTSITMPTTCGFPNCKFRSRYRGADDNRHFYRVPKKPPILRERWLQAIGRTEDTIVNQEILTNPFSSSSSSSFVHVVIGCDDANERLDSIIAFPSKQNVVKTAQNPVAAAAAANTEVVEVVVERAIRRKKGYIQKPERRRRKGNPFKNHIKI